MKGSFPGRCAPRFHGGPQNAPPGAGVPAQAPTGAGAARSGMARRPMRSQCGSRNSLSVQNPRAEGPVVSPPR
eukprot:1028381-Pyramimonas_sp.AAC.1